MIRSLLNKFNRLNLGLLLFLTACCNYLSFKLYGGEEQYFAFAKQFFNPHWIPGSFSLTHPAGGNLFFEIIVGFLLQYISFENLAFFGRMTDFLLLALPLSKIFRFFKLTNIEAVFLFQLFFLPHQSIFAGEWIFQNFEVKTLAYIFVFYSLYYLLNKNIQLSALFSALATLFHFLVGGWFFLFSVIYFLIRKESLKKTGSALILYGIITFPFIFYLARVYFFNNPVIINGINTNYIYSYERLPFHLGIFKSWSYFTGVHLDGVIISLILYLLCIFVFSRLKNSQIRDINLLNIIIFSEQFIFIIIAIFDKNGILLKTYPFRTSSLSALLMMIEFLLVIKFYLRKYFSNQKAGPQRSIFFARAKRRIYANSANAVMLLLFLVFFSIECVETLKGRNTDLPEITPDMKEMMEYIKNNTLKEDVFLFTLKEIPLSFHRIAEREAFVVWKFTPTSSKSIYQWYNREEWRKRVAQNISLIDELKKLYRVDYVISDSTYEYSTLKLAKSIGRINLYMVAE